MTPRRSLLPIVAALAALLPGACARREAPPAAGCEAQVNADPVVRDLILKGAGSEHFKWENEDRLRQARKDAEVACLQGRGLLPRGGGVEPPRSLY